MADPFAPDATVTGQEPSDSTVDTLVDDFVAGDFDWRNSVRSYPLSALAFAAIGGFYLGRRYGLQLLGDLSAFAADELLRQIPNAVEVPWGKGAANPSRPPL